MNPKGSISVAVGATYGWITKKFKRTRRVQYKLRIDKYGFN